MGQFYKKFLITLLVVLAIGFGTLKAYRFFYPVQNRRPPEKKEEVLPVDRKGSNCLTADTEFVLQEISLQDGMLVSERRAVPEQLIGMTREEVVSYLRDLERAPSLSDRQKGLQSLELSSFSSSRVVISGYYEPPETTGFYLVAKNHYVSVYKEDRKSCVQDTCIYLGNLPDALQLQIIAGKYVENQKALYDFLETYTS